ncbi:MAG: DNA repair protein RadC [Spirochaetaceae bacterium]|nr:DNA repair protein RadC [Spirochaetaceae bacterium]
MKTNFYKSLLDELEGASVHDSIAKSAAAADAAKTASAHTACLRQLPRELRPMERLRKEGREALSDKELLALLLWTGVKGTDVMTLSGDLLKRIDSEKTIPTVDELCKLTGLGQSKACSVVAMLEFGRRRWGTQGKRVRCPSDIFELIRHYADCPQEQFIALSLNGAHEVLATRIVTTGLVNKTIVHPREVFADAIGDRASAVCVAHNHPSGDAKPSPKDDETTHRLKDAGGVLGIRLLDHLVFTKDAYYSYLQSKRL